MTSSLEDLLIAHMNRPMPTFLDQEVIATTPDEAVEDKIYDFALVKIGRDFNKEEEVISSLAVGVRSLYVTSLVHREVSTVASISSTLIPVENLRCSHLLRLSSLGLTHSQRLCVQPTP
jgi:hypothetical protein